MKTNLLSSLLLSASLLSLTPAALAQTLPEATFQAACYPIQHTLKCRLFFVNPEARPVSIVIRDAQGQKQHQEVLTGLAKFNRAYDLAPLGDGTYTFEVSQGKTLFTQAVTVETTHARHVALTTSPYRHAPAQTAPVLARTQRE